MQTCVCTYLFLHMRCYLLHCMRSKRFGDSDLRVMQNMPMYKQHKTLCRDFVNSWHVRNEVAAKETEACPVLRDKSNFGLSWLLHSHNDDFKRSAFLDNSRNCLQSLLWG